MTLFRQILLAFGVVLFMGGVNSAMANEKSAIQERLNQLVPGAPAASIKPSPIVGLYQVTIDTKVLYMSEDGQYLLNGSLIDLETRQNLTEAASNEVRKNALSHLDKTTMLIYPAKGKTLRNITVFTDIECPYCQKLHREIPALNAAGIEVRYLAYPRAGVGSEAFRKAAAVWCADNARQAMDKAMTGAAVVAKKCNHPVGSHLELGQRFEVNGTPNIILDTGERIPGYAPAKELIQILAPQQQQSTK